MTTIILNHLDAVAVLTGGLFTGASLYIGISQLPALRASRLSDYWKFFPYLLDNSVALPALTSTAGLASVLHGSRIVGSSIDRNLWIASGSVFLAMVPYSIFAIGPINKLIVRDNAVARNSESGELNDNQRQALVKKLNGLYIIRTVSAVVGFGAMIYGLSRHSSLVLN